MTEDQLTKKTLMQDQIVDIENRLKELRKPININQNIDDDMGAIMPLLLDCLVEMNLTNWLEGLTDFAATALLYLHLECHVDLALLDHVEPDLHDALNNRLNGLRYGSITPNQEEKNLAKRLSERQREIAQIPKGTVKSRKSKGLFQLTLPDTPPPTPNKMTISNSSCWTFW